MVDRSASVMYIEQLLSSTCKNIHTDSMQLISESEMAPKQPALPKIFLSQ